MTKSLHGAKVAEIFGISKCFGQKVLRKGRKQVLTALVSKITAKKRLWHYSL